MNSTFRGVPLLKTTMRNALVSALLEHDLDDRFCFLTGDLGFNALEPLRDRLGKRFINMGIAEQNMISVAAGLARSGMRPWVYTIGPFCLRSRTRTNQKRCLPAQSSDMPGG